MELINPLVEKYASQLTSSEDELLQDIHEHTVSHHPHAHMLSSHVQGKFLSFISTIIQPSYILEIGTFTGYSGLCLCEGLKENGELHTIELREEDAATAQRNFSKSTYNNRIHLHIGNALEIIPTFNIEWDLIFIDADKTGYIDYYELLIPKMKKNGLMIADNVLFHGQVLEEHVKGKSALAIKAFNEHVQQDERTEQVLLTVRDGLFMIKKKQ